MRSLFLSSLLLLFFLFFMPSISVAQEAAGDRSVEREPIQISSDRMVSEQQMNKVTFSGHVVAQQGDVTIYAEDLILVYPPDRRDIERVEAYQDVRIVQGERLATAEKAIYYGTEGRIVLTGSPRLHQGQSFIEGEEIIFFIDEEKSLVKSNEGRVNAVFQPQGEK